MARHSVSTSEAAAAPRTEGRSVVEARAPMYNCGTALEADRGPRAGPISVFVNQEPAP